MTNLKKQISDSSLDLIGVTKTREKPISKLEVFQEQTRRVDLETMQKMTDFRVTPEGHGYLVTAAAAHGVDEARSVWLGFHIPDYCLVNRWDENVFWLSGRDVHAAIDGSELTIFQKKFYEPDDFCIHENGCYINELGETRKVYSMRYVPFFYGDRIADKLCMAILGGEEATLYGFWPGCFWGDGENYHFRLSPEADGFDSLLFFSTEKKGTYQMLSYAIEHHLEYFQTETIGVLIIPMDKAWTFTRKNPSKLAQILRAELIYWMEHECRMAKKVDEVKRAKSAEGEAPVSAAAASSILEQTEACAYEIRNLTREFQGDPILGALSRYNVRLDRTGFYFTSTEVNIYWYSKENAEVLEAIIFNMKQVVPSSSDSDKYRTVRAVYALSADLTMKYDVR